MSPIVLMGRYGFLLFIVMLVSIGCGTPNDLAPFDSDAGKHASDWVYAKHAAVSDENINSCMECHGSDLAGGMSGVPCSQCHLNGSPLTLTECTSCHGKPPTGTVAPNRTGAHGAHYAFDNSTNFCNSCHSGAGTGTVSHDNGTVDVVFLSAYNAKSGTAVRNSDGTCSKVSCHGGQTTPSWLSGTIIDVNTQCSTCHAFGTAEYNSYSSGQHDFHVNTRLILCTSCHDTTNLATLHFASLNTTTLDGQAYVTLQSYLNYVKAAGTCDALCHPGVRSW